MLADALFTLEAKASAGMGFNPEAGISEKSKHQTWSTTPNVYDCHIAAICAKVQIGSPLKQ